MLALNEMVSLFPAHDHKPTMCFTLSNKAPQLKLTLLEPPERETLLHLTVRADFFTILAPQLAELLSHGID